MISKLKEYIQTFRHHKTGSRAYLIVLGNALMEIKSALPQFFTWRSPALSLFRGIKYTFLGFLRLLSGRIKLGYAYTGEDIILESLMNRKYNYQGFYVDVGCNNPRFISNSFLFYRRGWKGICIDANEKITKKYQYIRPRDKSVYTLVSSDTSKREFIEFTNNVLSTTEKINIKEYLESDQKILKTKTIIPRSLTSILDEYNVPEIFDFLSIDVEEHDFSALKSLDLSKYRPSWIIIECEEFNPSNPVENDIYQYLLKWKYIFKGYILKNLYFENQ